MLSVIAAVRVASRFLVIQTIRSEAPAEAWFLVAFGIVRLHKPLIDIDVSRPKSPTLTINFECGQSLSKCQVTHCAFRFLQASCHVVHPQWQATSILSVFHTFSLF
jgi:hypothetical protein